VREAQASADGVAARIISAGAQHDLAVARFQELTGLEAGSLPRIMPDLVPALPEGDLSQWQDEAEQQAPSSSRARSR
jgi:outer membrane protein TolC